jgi:hypothetical protein
MADDNPFDFAPADASANAPRPVDLIAEYIRLRDQKKEAEAQAKAWIDNQFTHRMDRIETELMAFLNDAGSESVKTGAGTAFKRIETSITVADQKEFSRFVIGSQAWDLLDFRASKTGVKSYLEENQNLPPGLNHTTATVISVRKPS